MSTYPTINWVTQGNSDDFRPTMGADGQSVVFERSGPNPKTKLYLKIIGGGTAAPILPTLDTDQTRPDWCWRTNKLAFDSDLSIRIMTGGATQSTLLPGTDKFIYPQWNSDGSALTVMNSASGGGIKPCSSVINPQTGAIQLPNINGSDSGGVAVFGGMPAVKPHSTSNHIAFAGQPALDNWNPGSTSASYDQNNNYIFLNHPDRMGNFSSSPMESGAPTGSFDPNYQGRAPAWSPDGNFVVFESTRNGGKFALFLMDVGGSGSPVQLTDTVYNAAHAKFFPGGKKLIFSAKPISGSHGKIAWIDISAYV